MRVMWWHDSKYAGNKLFVSEVLHYVAISMVRGGTVLYARVVVESGDSISPPFEVFTPVSELFSVTL